MSLCARNFLIPNTLAEADSLDWAPQHSMTDVLIAGGGLAGSALAIRLGHMGFGVELFERSRFPREKPCGEGMMPGGLAALLRLGVAGTLGGEPFSGVRFHFRQQVAAGRFPSSLAVPLTGRGIRRRHLDQILFEEATRTPGVTAYVGARVERPLVEHGRIAGLIVEGSERRASLVVGADGPHSRLRHALSLDVPSQEKWVGMRAHFRLADSQPQAKWVDVYHGPGYELYATPLPAGELLVAALARTAAIHGRIEDQFRTWCTAEPKLRERLEGSRQVSELMAISPLSGGARRSFLPGFILLGDAAGFTDPITGGGMTHALLAAELLAKYAEQHFGKSEAWLAEFDRKRRALLRDFRMLTRIMVTLTAHPRWMAAIMRGLRLSPALFSHLVGVSSGVCRLWGGEHGLQEDVESPQYASVGHLLQNRADS